MGADNKVMGYTIKKHLEENSRRTKVKGHLKRHFFKRFLKVTKDTKRANDKTGLSGIHAFYRLYSS